MLKSLGIEPGFCFGALLCDGETRIFVNICGHSDIGRALAKSSDEVPDSYLDDFGIDNLVVPISVGHISRPRNGKDTFVVDVVVHPSLTRRCSEGHRLFKHYIARLTSLAIEWILQERGLRIDSKTCKLLSDRKYFETHDHETKKTLLEFSKSFENAMNGCSSDNKDAESVSLPSKLNIDASAAKDSKRSPLIVEMPSANGIRKGFLNNKRLYDSRGSTECSLPAMDPLHHIPETLRKRCQVVDMRDVESTTTAPTSSSHGESSPIDPPKVLPKRQWCVESVTYEKEKIVVRFRPPEGVSSMKGVELTASLSSLEVDGTMVDFSRDIVVEGVSAKFLKSSKTMVVTCPTS